MPTTTNFGWTTPADTDLVKDGASAIRTLGNGIDTSMADLKGGTTGQYLVKNSNTDMDFTWTTNTADIDGITATSPLTGGGTSGTITVGIQDASTTQKGAIQLTDSTSSTSTTTAATPASVKSAYDLANGAIPKTLTTTTGDIIYASSANTPARLGIGSTNQVLTVSGGVPTWAAAGGGLTWANGASGNLPAAGSLSLSISSKESIIIRLSNLSVSADCALYLRVNNSSSSVYDYNGFSHTTNTTVTTNYIKQINDTKFELNYPNGFNASNTEGTWYIRLDGCKQGGFVSMYTTGLCKNVGDNNLAISFGGMYQTSAAVTSVDLVLSTGQFDNGTYEWWAA